VAGSTPKDGFAKERSSGVCSDVAQLLADAPMDVAGLVCDAEIALD
jgi:hypothetical protein